MQPMDYNMEKEVVTDTDRNTSRRKRSSNPGRNERRADAAYADKSFGSSYKIYNSDNSPFTRLFCRNNCSAQLEKC